MNLANITQLIGKKETHDELLREMSRSGVNLQSELRLPDGEYRAYIERPNDGYSLVFTDEAVFLGIGSQAIGVGELYLSGIFLYAEGKDGYTQFQGELPNKLSFDMTNDDFENLFGEPSWERRRPDGSRAADRWDDIENYRIHVTYSKHNAKPTLISLNQADKQR